MSKDNYFSQLKLLLSNYDEEGRLIRKHAKQVEMWNEVSCNSTIPTIPLNNLFPKT
jgi:hypothetical protein